MLNLWSFICGESSVSVLSCSSEWWLVCREVYSLVCSRHDCPWVSHLALLVYNYSFLIQKILVFKKISYILLKVTRLLWLWRCFIGNMKMHRVVTMARDKQHINRLPQGTISNKSSPNAVPFVLNLKLFYFKKILYSSAAVDRVWVKWNVLNQQIIYLESNNQETGRPLQTFFTFFQVTHCISTVTSDM
jgi:hypothetical protein